MAFVSATKRKEDWRLIQTSKDRVISNMSLETQGSFGRRCCLHIFCAHSFQILATMKGAISVDITKVQIASLPFIVAKTARQRTEVQGINECQNALQMHLQQIKRQ